MRTPWRAPIASAMRSRHATSRFASPRTTRSPSCSRGCATSCRGCSRRAELLRERLARGHRVVLAQARELALGARDEGCNLVLVEAIVVRRDLRQRVPQRELAAHAGAQPLELEHAAERRVAG